MTKFSPTLSWYQYLIIAVLAVLNAMLLRYFKVSTAPVWASVCLLIGSWGMENACILVKESNFKIKTCRALKYIAVLLIILTGMHQLKII